MPHATHRAHQSPSTPAFSPDELLATLPRVRESIHVVRDGSGRVGVTLGDPTASGCTHLATLPPLYPEWLGDRAFNEVHGTRFPYVAGAMANGIATTDMVIAMAEAGMLGFFGAAGLTVERIGREVAVLQERLGDRLPWGSNLIHAPNEPDVEAGTVQLYLDRGVRRVSASAYMALTPMIVRYAATGLTRDRNGAIQRRNHVFAKISRPEVAARFLSPAPREMLERLVATGQLTPAEAELAAQVPVAEDIIVESDSGGHTDNRPLTSLFPVILALRDAMASTHGYTRPIRVGAAGGLGTPSAVAAAFGLGAAFVLTGSVNQGAVESGLDASGRALLAMAGLADVVMAPAADMFELGVTVQVLRRGTMFGVRAQKLYELYRAYASWDEVPAAERATVEKQLFQKPYAEVWEGCVAFFTERDPRELAKAARDRKHEMALVFRWYLGLSSRWAIAGDPARRMDYQIWCGPAMGAFNDWVRGSFLEPPENRTVVQIARNLLEGAAVVTRAHQLRTYGVAVPGGAFQFAPRPLQ
jgi:PfaD family protein